MESKKEILKSLIGRVYSDITFEVTPDYAILYALATGCTQGPELYEKAKGFGTFPTISSCLGSKDVDAFFVVPELKDLCDGKSIPELVLHGEEDIESIAPVEPGKTYRIVSRIIDIVDKGKMLLFITKKEIIYEGKICTNVISKTVLRTVGGTGFKSGIVLPAPVKIQRPKEAPSCLAEFKLSPTQAALYRILGDKNPFHIDWEMAKSMNYTQPILHGLCTLAVSTRRGYEALIT
jgi:acyl dehydratase